MFVIQVTRALFLVDTVVKVDVECIGGILLPFSSSVSCASDSLLQYSASSAGL